MPTYTVRRTIQTIATADAGSTSIAKSTAVDEVREQLTDAASSAVDDIDIESAEIFEFPAGPFDPYRLTVTISLAVTVEAADEATAIDSGEDAIETLVTAADLDEVEYLGTTQLDPLSD